MPAGIFSNDMTTGLPRSLSDKLTLINAHDCPFLAMVRKGGDVTQLKDEWPMDKFLDAEDSATPDGKDVDEHESTNDDYAIVSNRIQNVRPKAVKIGKLAQNVVNQAGIANQKAYAVKKKLDQLWRSCEATLCSDQDVQAGTSTVGDKTRAVGKWISTPITTSGYEVPTDYLPVSGQIYSGATASLTEVGTTNSVNSLLYATYKATGKNGVTFKGLVGGLLKQQFTSYTRVASGSTIALSIRTYQQTDLSKVVWGVDQFQGDHGKIDLVNSTYLGLTSTAGKWVASAGNADERRGYFLNMPFWEIVWKQMPQVTPLPNNGGGERFMVDAILLLRCHYPGANFKVSSTS